MKERHIVIVGGGLAGLSAGCYALANGFRTTILEHNLALGGVCTAWHRGPYTIDGCIHWLTGGAFQRLYEELEIVPRVPLRTIDRFVTYHDARDGLEVTLARDLETTATALCALAPEDADEIRRLMDGAESIVHVAPPIDHPVELSSMRELLGQLWSTRHDLGTIAHFRKPIGVWCAEHLKNERLRGVFTRLVPEHATTLVLLMMLGYLKHGYLSRPEGGTARFRNALVDTYRSRGGETLLQSTVDEIMVDGARACGVRLADGSIIECDVVVSTASAPETVLRLLGGRYGAVETRERMEQWNMFRPIVLASYGVATPLAHLPSSSIVDHVQPMPIGGVVNEHLSVRVYNEDGSFAPRGHTVVQAMVETDYDFWAKTGSRYNAEKDAVADLVLERLDRHVPGLKAAVRVADLATPLTFWQHARSWRGAYEGWLPTPQAMFGHVKKVLPGLDGFYMAGQWVEPGGGVPTALMSGRRAIQLVCADEGRPFASRVGAQDRRATRPGERALVTS